MDKAFLQTPRSNYHNSIKIGINLSNGTEKHISDPSIIMLRYEKNRDSYL